MKRKKQAHLNTLFDIIRDGVEKHEQMRLDMANGYVLAIANEGIISMKELARLTHVIATCEVLHEPLQEAALEILAEHRKGMTA